MKRSILALVVATGLTLSASAALACPPPPMSPDQTRLENSTEVLVGEVLAIDVVESGDHGGVEVDLYKVTLRVDDTLLGATTVGDLATIYIVADHANSEGAEKHRIEPMYMDGYSPVPAGSIGQTELPEASKSYLFYAKSLSAEGDDLVLGTNSPFFFEEAESSRVTTARNNVKTYLTYGAIYY